MSNLPMDDVVRIVVNLSPRAAIRRGFNLGLIVGPSPVISASDRVKLYSSTDSMFEDGFTEDMPEYKAARLYFSQSSRPTRVAIGRQVITEDLGEFAVTNVAEPSMGGFTVTSVDGATAGDFAISWDKMPAAGNSFAYYTPYDLSVLPGYLDALDNPWLPIISGDDITPNPGRLT